MAFEYVCYEYDSSIIIQVIFKVSDIELEHDNCNMHKTTRIKYKYMPT